MQLTVNYIFLIATEAWEISSRERIFTKKLLTSLFTPFKIIVLITVYNCFISSINLIDAVNQSFLLIDYFSILIRY